MPRVALITGITGQDGAYPVHLLLHRRYPVLSGFRRSSVIDLKRLDCLGVELMPLDLLKHWQHN